MLRHSIIKHNNNDVKPDRRKLIFERALQKCTFEEGDAVKRNNKAGVVASIVDKFEEAHWQDHMCLLVEVYLLDKQTTVMCHPSELRKAYVSY